MIQAIIFDMDGVLIDSMPFWKKSVQTTMTKVGGSFSDDLWQEHRGKRLDELVEQWYESSPWKSGKTTEEVVSMILDQVIESIKKKGEPKPGVKETLKFLSKKEIPLSLASSSKPEVIETVLDTLELRSFFQSWHSADQEEYGKPHPAVYMSAADSLDSEITECLIIEDSVTGMVAAKASGAKCLVVPEFEDVLEKRHLKEHQFWLADLQLKSLEQLPKTWQVIENLFK